MIEPQIIDLITGLPPRDGYSPARDKAEAANHPAACHICWGAFGGRLPNGSVIYIPHATWCAVAVREREMEAAAERFAALGFGHAFGDCPPECGCQDADGGAAEFSATHHDSERSSLVEQSNAREHQYLGGGPE